jgi:hypothetical protein
LNLFLHETMLAVNFQIFFLRTNKCDGQVLPAKSAGQVRRPRLPAMSAGQVCRPSLPAKSAGQVCRPSLPAKSLQNARHNKKGREASNSVE